MFKKRISALCAFGVALSATWLQAQDLFVLPGAGASNGVVQAFVTNPLTTFRTFSAPVGSFALLPNLDATKFFIVGTSTTNSIFSMDGTFLTAAVVANLPSPANQALITPDGKLLAVSAGTLHLFSTTSNAELVSGGISQGAGISTISIAASLDAATIFALGSNGNGGAQLNSVSTSTHTITGTLALAHGATAVGVAPNGRVYVSLPDEILEVDPRTLQPTTGGAITVSGTPGPLVFTTDGQYAIGVNQAAFGNTLIVAALTTHTSSNPNLGLAPLTSLQVIGVDTLLGLSGQSLYQIKISQPVSVIPISVPELDVNGLQGFTTTNDIPAGAHSTVDAVYLISDAKLYQFNPATQTVITSPPPQPVTPNVTPGGVAYAVPVVTTSQAQPASLLNFGNNQTILPNTTSEPLVVQVLDAASVPLSGYAVQFQTSGGGTLSSSSVVTGSNGYAVNYLTSSASTTPITVTATAGSLVANFSVNVSATGQSGGGPNLSIIAGQGQLMLADTNTANPGSGSSLQVLATDLNANPIAGLAVTFSVPSTDGTIEVSGFPGSDSQTVNTNSAGVASVDFLSTSLGTAATSQGYLQSLVTASATGSNAVAFYITTINSVNVNPVAPERGILLTGQEGSTLATPVQAQVVSTQGIGIPNVSLTFVNSNPDVSLEPTVSCDSPGGIALTDSTGRASCALTFGPRLGSSTFTPTVGYTEAPWGAISFKVTPGAPADVQIKQGNNQTGTPGERLPLALLVHVTDSGGNTATGASVNWQVASAPGTVTLSNEISTTDSNGNASALATLGSIAGVAQVTATAGSATATFNLTVNIPSAAIQKVSGDQQSVTVGAAFPSPLVVKVVDSNGNGVAGAQVNFQVATGVATLGSSSVITDSTGTASTTVTAGATPGTITVTATTSTLSATFTLTAQPLGPSKITIVNGASFSSNTGISPGGIATIRGVGILPGVQGLISAANSAGQLPSTFSGVTISFNGTPAPIYYVQDINGADQVSVQVPFEVQPGPAVTLEVSVANEGSASVNVLVKPLAPGVFTSSYGGKNYAVAVRPDGSYVSPTNPAQRGEDIQLYVTGLGQATPAIEDGAAGVANQPIIAPMVIGLNGSGVPLISAVYGPGLIGVYVVTLHVPADTQTGPYQPIGVIAVDSNGVQHYAQSTYMPIQ